MRFSKRNLIKILGISGAGIFGLGSEFLTRKSLAASWQVNNATAETIDGEISNLQIKQANFELDTFEWNNLDSNESDHVFTVRFLASTESMSSHEEIGVGEFSRSSDSGSINSISFDVNPFPVNFLSAPSISASDFESSSDGGTESTTVDLKIVFETDSVSDSATQSFDVNVTNLTGWEIDNFEDGDLSEYSVFNGGGSESIESSIVVEGSKSVKINTESTGSTHAIQSSSGLDQYPESGDTYQYKVYLPNSSTTGYHFFGYQDSNNRYQVQTKDGDSSLYIRNSGSFTKLDGSTASLPTGEWLTVIIDWGGGGVINVTIKNDTGTSITTFSGTDRTFTEGSVGWGAGGGSSTETCYFDAAKITKKASETGTIDDFEDGDVSEYEFIQDGTWSAQTNTVYEGTYALTSDPTTDNNPDLASLDGLPRYPKAGDTFEWYTYMESSETESVTFWGFDSNTGLFGGFMVKLTGSPGGHEIVLSGPDGTSSSASWTPQTNEWLRCEVEWNTDGTTTLTVEDSNGNTIDTVSITASGWADPGGIGWKTNTADDTADVFFDNTSII